MGVDVFVFCVFLGMKLVALCVCLESKHGQNRLHRQVILYLCVFESFRHFVSI